MYNQAFWAQSPADFYISIKIKNIFIAPRIKKK